MNKLIIDPQCGIAGDMLTAAFISAGLDSGRIVSVMERSAIQLGGARIEARVTTRENTDGIILDIDLLKPPHSTEAGIIKNQLQAMLKDYKITQVYSDFAMRTIDILINAEKAAHAGINGHSHADSCHLHEAQDIIIDIIGTCWALQYFQINMANVTCLSPVVMGSGKIHFSHGTFDVPAPAAKSIIEQYKLPVISGDIQTELLTPTGAALLASLGCTYLSRETFYREPKPEQRMVGVGFGTKDLTRKYNALNCVKIYIDR